MNYVPAVDGWLPVLASCYKHVMQRLSKTSTWSYLNTWTGSLLDGAPAHNRTKLDKNMFAKVMSRPKNLPLQKILTKLSWSTQKNMDAFQASSTIGCLTHLHTSIILITEYLISLWCFWKWKHMCYWQCWIFNFSWPHQWHQGWPG
jgi:hypothetical protein